MTQYTGNWGKGYPVAYNAADFTTADLDIVAVGQWTGPGKWGAPAAYNDSDFTTGAVTPGGDYVLQEIAFTAELDGTVSPFDRQDFIFPAEAVLSMEADLPLPAAAVVDVDSIRVSLAQSWAIRVMWT